MYQKNPSCNITYLSSIYIFTPLQATPAVSGRTPSGEQWTLASHSSTASLLINNFSCLLNREQRQPTIITSTMTKIDIKTSKISVVLTILLIFWASVDVAGTKVGVCLGQVHGMLGTGVSGPVPFVGGTVGEMVDNGDGTRLRVIVVGGTVGDAVGITDGIMLENGVVGEIVGDGIGAGSSAVGVTDGIMLENGVVGEIDGDDIGAGSSS